MFSVNGIKKVGDNLKSRRLKGMWVTDCNNERGDVRTDK